MGFAGVIRVPKLRRRLGRDIERLTFEGNIVDVNGAIQLDSQGRIVLIIATDEPLSQTSAGLVLEIAAGEPLSKSASGLALDLGAGQTLLNHTGSTLQIDEDEFVRQILLYETSR